VTLLPASLGAITLFVDDLARSRRFYEDVFGLEPIFADDVSAAFRFENAIVNLLLRGEAHGLIAPAEVALAGSRFQLTIRVADADAACELLRAKGVELLNGPVDREWGVRTAAFADPSGHVWEVAQELAD
jgi:catechol 2,3-dioxygenase-like lactoylglutathione lyase family enzyme